MKPVRQSYVSLAALCLAVLTLASCGKEQPAPEETTAVRDTEAVTTVDTPPETEADTRPVETETIPATAETEPAETEIETETEAETKPEAEPNLLVPAITPTPVYMSTAAGELAVGLCPERFTVDENGSAFAHLLTDAGATLGENGLPVAVTYRDLSADFEYGADEAYILTVSEEGVTVEAQTERGAFYAMTTLCSMLEKGDGNIPVITVKDAPRNAQRGVIEGFYGKAYTHEFRKELFAFMGENKMNAYIYAPKDDPKHRNQWRTLYTGSELEIMTDLISTARENYVKFIYAISPGGDINLDEHYESDFHKLEKKCQQMYDLGVRDFAIFLDDIPTLDAEGHAMLLNDFQTKFVETHEGVSNLIAITTEYTDSFLTEYTDIIAPLIHKDIELMWTGPGVSPEKIAKTHLRTINRTYGREVFIWWNYPVNDVLVNNLYMDACRGLAANLHESITGLVANPMNQGYASMVPLYTTADYLWNSEAYDGDASLRAACEALAPDVSEALLHFISMTCASPMNKYTDSVMLESLLRVYRIDPTEEATEALRAYFEEMIRNADLLARMENQDIYTDIADWVAKYRAFGVMGLAYVDMNTVSAAGGSANDLLPLLGAYREAELSIKGNARLVSANVLAPFLDALPTKLNQLFGLDGEGSASIPVITTSLPTYPNYPLENAGDGLVGTFFWSSRGGVVDDYIQLDLGAAVEVSRVIFNARNASAGESDYVRNGELYYSVDGNTWTSICAVNQPVNEIDVQVTARYFRVVVKQNQDYWITISEFSATTEDNVSESLALDEYFVSRYNLLALLDNRIFTALDVDDAAAEGHSLLVTVGDAGSITILSYALPENQTQAVIKDGSGAEIGRVTLDYVTSITAPAGSVVEIPLGHGLRLVEIY